MLQGGGLLCERSSILTRDGAVVLACCVDSVLAFSAASGNQLYALQHGSPVTALCAHPKDDTLLYSSTVGGDIILWDLTTGTEAQRWQLDSPVESLVVSDAESGEHTLVPLMQGLANGTMWMPSLFCFCAWQVPALCCNYELACTCLNTS